MENILIHILGAENHNFLSAITQRFIIYHELEHLTMYVVTVTDMNETYIVPGDNSNTDIDLGYEKKFHNGLSDYDNKSIYVPSVSTLSEESAISMNTDEDAVDYITKNSPPCGRSHVCAQGAAAST